MRRTKNSRGLHFVGSMTSATERRGKMRRFSLATDACRPARSSCATTGNGDLRATQANAASTLPVTRRGTGGATIYSFGSRRLLYENRCSENRARAAMFSGSTQKADESRWKGEGPLLVLELYEKDRHVSTKITKNLAPRKETEKKKKLLRAREKETKNR